MSEEALNEAIAAKWTSAGLDAGIDDLEVETEPDVAEATEGLDDDDPPSADDSPADPPLADDATDEPAETPDATEIEPPVAEKTATEQAVADAEDELAAALGLGKPPEDPKKRAAWWKQRVPYSQVHKIVTEQQKKLKEAHENAVKEYTGKISDYDTRFTDVKKVEDIITNNAEQYVQTLAALFPETYGKMFAPILGGGNGEAKPLLVDETDPGPKPEANYKLPDGSMTYDVEGYQKLMDWQQKVTEQNMLKRFKPHLDFVSQQQKEAERQQKVRLAEEQKQRGLETSKKALAEVETWDLGKENLEAILAEAAKLPEEYSAELALNIAYRKIVLPKLKANRDEMQAQILKDMKKQSAKQTAVGLTQTKTTTPASAGNVDLDTRIKNAWKKKGYI